MRRMTAALAGIVVAVVCLGLATDAQAQCNSNDATHEYFNGAYTAPQRMVMSGGVFSFLEECALCEVAPGWTPWRDDWADNGDYYFGPFTPAGQPDPGIECDAQEIVVFYGSFGAVKQFQLESGKTYNVHIWIKNGNGADIGPPNPGANWIEYGYDNTGQTNDNDKPETLLWDIAPKSTSAYAAWGTWVEYVHPFPVTMDQGDTISVWLKTGSADPAGVTADYEYLWFEEVGGGGPDCYDLPEDFEGPFTDGIAENWVPINRPGGFSQNREETDGVTGKAQRLRSFDSDFGEVKLFNIPVNEPVTLSVKVRTSSSDGSENAAPGAIASLGVDPTGNYTDPGAATVVWNDALNADPEAGYDTWTEYTVGPVTSTGECASVWLWLNAIGQQETQGISVDYDDIQLAAGPPAPSEITDFQLTDSDEVTISFTSTSGIDYRVWFTDSLVSPSWMTNATSDVTAVGDSTDWTDDIMGVGSRTYRVEQNP